MFKTRLISSIVLMAITILIMLVGGPLLWVVLAAVSMAGVYELFRVMKMEKSSMGYIGYLGVLWWGLAVAWTTDGSLTWGIPVLILLFLAELLVFVLEYPKYHANQLFASVFGVIYVAVTLFFLYLTRTVTLYGEWLVWLVFIASWGSDTCAYAVGILIGKHKLAPILSPKKSIEGSIGGVLGAAAIGALFGYVMCYVTGEPFKLIGVFALIGGVGSVISQIGDLAASGIKRCYDIKDYGKLIPGHGGILDRFDSVIVTAPIVYYLAMFILG